MDRLAYDVDVTVGDVAAELMDTYRWDVSHDHTSGSSSGSLTMTPSMRRNISFQLRYSSTKNRSNQPAGRIVIRMTESCWVTQRAQLHVSLD